MSAPSLADLIAALPAARAAAVFTHPSWAAERGDSYERLEFLGDAVLGLAIAGELFRRFPEYEEGQLAKLRAHVVSRASCAIVSEELGLGARLLANNPDPDRADTDRLGESRNVRAALLEAAIAAVYLEHGLEVTSDAIVGAFGERISYGLTNRVDYKTELQEQAAQTGRKLSYELLETEGPPHLRLFTVAAVIDGAQVGVGRGGSKKDAEQEAARQVLEADQPDTA